MSSLKNSTALSLVLGLGLALATTGPALAAEKSESSAAHQETLPSSSNLGAAGAAKTPSVAGKDYSDSQEKKPNMEGEAETEKAATIPGGLEAEEIVGRDVVNKNGDEVGQVEALVIQPDKGDVHAVVSVGGFLGMGDRDVAIPLKEMEFGEENVTLMSQQTKEELEAMPEYEESEWSIYEE